MARLDHSPGRYTLSKHKSSCEDLIENCRYRRVMKAKPSSVEAPGRAKKGRQAPAKRPMKKVPQRLPRAERQARVLAKAAEYFAEHGLNAQTRAIAEACGISQRLLYSLF